MRQKLNSEFIHPDFTDQRQYQRVDKLTKWMKKRNAQPIKDAYADTAGSLINSGRRAETQLKKHLKMTGKQIRKYLKEKKRELHSDGKSSGTQGGMDQQVAVRND